MEFQWPVRVYYEDTDAGGVVYYANYLKFMERARSEWLRARGFEQDDLRDNEQVIFAVRHVEIDYLLPARFNDLLAVSVKIAEIGTASIQFEQAVTDGEQKVFCTGQVKIACLDASTLRPQRLPESILLELKKSDG